MKLEFKIFCELFDVFHEQNENNKEIQRRKLTTFWRISSRFENVTKSEKNRESLLTFLQISLQFDDFLIKL